MVYTKKQAEHIACPTTKSESCQTDKCSAWRWTNNQVLKRIKPGNLAGFNKPKLAPVFEEIGLPGLSIKVPLAAPVEPIFKGTGEYYGFCGLGGKPEHEWGAEEQPAHDSAEG